MKKQSIILFVVLFLIGLMISAGTYAYWVWTSNVDKNVVFTTAGMENYVVYNEGESYFVGNFQPSPTYCSGISNTISFYKTSEAIDVNLVATIYMDVNSIGDNIAASDDVYWVIVSGDNTVCPGSLDDALGYGTFNGVSDGDVLTLTNDIEVIETEQKFTVWIWIDESGTDLSLLSGESVDTNIWTQIDMLE